jgi:hypothetical protein
MLQPGNMATPAVVVASSPPVHDKIPLAELLPMERRIVAVMPPVATFPLASSIATWRLGENGTPEPERVGGWRNASFVANPTTTSNAAESAGVKMGVEQARRT